MKPGRDILSGFGPESKHPQAARATSGGVTQAKPMNYSPPQGPTNIGDPKGPGLHGDNHSTKQCCVPHSGGGRSGGGPGIGGTNHGNRGSQR